MSLSQPTVYPPEKQLQELQNNTQLGQKLIAMRRKSCLKLARLGVPTKLSLDYESIRQQLINEIREHPQTILKL